MMTSRIGGKRWRVGDLRGIKLDKFGNCDYGKKIIHIPLQGDTRHELDTTLHEIIHASCPRMEEDAVNTTAGDIARLLWRLGWRKGYD